MAHLYLARSIDMTIKDFERNLSYIVMVHWLGEDNFSNRETWPLSSNTPPDRLGETNPDAETTRWEWDTDLSPEEEAKFDKYVNIARAGDTEENYDAQQPQIDILKLYKNSNPPTTDAQKDAAIRAIIEYLIIDRKEDLV